MFIYNYLALITWIVAENYENRNRNNQLISAGTVMRSHSSGDPIPVSVIASSSDEAREKAVGSLPKPSQGAWTLTLTGVSSIPAGAE